MTARRSAWDVPCRPSLRRSAPCRGGPRAAGLGPDAGHWVRRQPRHYAPSSPPEPYSGKESPQMDLSLGS